MRFQDLFDSRLRTKAQVSNRVEDGALVQSSNGKFYREYDYFLLGIEALDRREDWRTAMRELD